MEDSEFQEIRNLNMFKAKAEGIITNNPDYPLQISVISDSFELNWKHSNKKTSWILTSLLLNPVDSADHALSDIAKCLNRGWSTAIAEKVPFVPGAANDLTEKITNPIFRQLPALNGVHYSINSDLSSVAFYYGTPNEISTSARGIMAALRLRMGDFVHRDQDANSPREMLPDCCLGKVYDNDHDYLEILAIVKGIDITNYPDV